MNTVLVVALSLIATVASAERYDLPFTRVKTNLYRIVGSNVYVKTQNCTVQLWNTKATLSYTTRAKEDRLIFADGSSCRVISVNEWKGVPQRRVE